MSTLYDRWLEGNCGWTDAIDDVRKVLFFASKRFDETPSAAR